MGRGEELSEFQRGTVVGCHLCKKSVREISALLNLPRSTVSAVILRWKRGGITTALPRSGRPHKLKEEHRQLLERVALEKCLPSIKAIAAEFQTTSGANVSCSTVRRELHEMGIQAPLSSNGKHKAGQRTGKKKAALGQEDTHVDVSRLDLRVGRILTTVQLPHTDSLYMQIELGEVIPRTVVSELATHVPVDQGAAVAQDEEQSSSNRKMQNRLVVVLCNMQPVVVGGVVNEAMIMCASSQDKVELLDPPSGAVPGDIITFQGFPGKPDKELNPKKKVWEQVQPGLHTDAQCIATYKGAAFEVIGKGVCKVQTMSEREIK